MRIPVKEYFKLLWRYLLPQLTWVVALGIAIIVSIGFSLWIPQYLKSFIDMLMEGESIDRLRGIALVFISISIAKRGVDVVVSYVGTRVSWAATNALRENLVRHCLALDVDFHQSYTPGEMLERIDGDVSVLNGFFSLFITQVISNALLLLGIVVLAWSEDWRIGLVFAVFPFVVFIVCGKLKHRGVGMQIAARNANSILLGFLEEHVAGAEDVSGCGASKSVCSRFVGLAKESFRKELGANLYAQLMLSVAWICFQFLNASTLGLGAYFYLEGTFTIGVVYLVYHYAVMIRQPIQGFLMEFERMVQAGASISRLNEILGKKSMLENGAGVPLPCGALCVEFNNVGFSYEKGKTDLRNVSFTLAAGKTLGVVGKTGGGKSTLAKLLFRFYQSDWGSIKVGGVDVQDLDLNTLRQRIKYVTQNSHLFEGTIRENLTFFNDDISDEKIKRAIGELGLQDWFSRFGHGLDTCIGSGREGLSAGEVQLLSLVRVMLSSDASLIILDEVSSRLDGKSESLVNEAIRRLARGRTVLIIAHHLSTLNWVDDILVLEGGRVVEYGGVEELLMNCESSFSKLSVFETEGVKS